MPIKLAIAEDQALFRKGMISLLNSIPDFEVVVEAENGLDLVNQFKRIVRRGDELPEVTILDLRMPEMDGVKTTKELNRLYPEHKIIIVSAHDDADIIVYLYEKGANAFLDKNAEPKEVERAIRNVMLKGIYFNNDARMALEETRSDGSNNQIHFDVKDSLSERDRDLLRLICQEKTALEIANELSLSKKTVDNYRNKLLQKTQAKNITGLVLYAVRSNLVNISELKINSY